MMRIEKVLAALLLGVAPSALAAQQAASSGSSPQAAPAAPAAADTGADDDIVVTGSRVLPGGVVGDIPPEQSLGPADIRSYGVSSVSDLLNELSPQTRSDRGRGSGAPVVLLNGRRVSSFAEIRDIPTEAIARVDILPEEVALKYGYSADQRVVNIVLRRRFRALTTEATDSQATEGTRNTPHGSLNVLNISGSQRFNLNLDYQTSNKVFENDRNITGSATSSTYDVRGNIVPGAGVTDGQIDPVLSALAGKTVTIAGVPATAATTTPTLAAYAATANAANTTDLRPYRTLLAGSQDFTANAVLARTIFGNVGATINGRVEYTSSQSDNGLGTVALQLPAGNPYSPFSRAVTLDRYVDGVPLLQTNQSLASHVGLTFNGDVKKWRWSVTGNYDRTDAKTFTTTGWDASPAQARLNANDPTFNPFGALLANVNPGGVNYATSTSNAGGFDALASGALLTLPAGSLYTSVHAGVTSSDFSSFSYRQVTGTTLSDVSRTVENGQLNIDLPIANKNKAFLSALGTLSLNFNIAGNHYSDFGTLTTIGYGANWAPIDKVRILVSVTDDAGAPTPQQLGNPVISTPNSRVFDYVRGTTVDVTQVTGGNPSLLHDEHHVFKAELNLKPISKLDWTLTANYIKAHTDNAIAAFPAATAAIEAAFPDRFQRDTAGDLTRIDSRPVNFQREDSEELRWGFNVSFQIKSKIQREIEAFRAGKGPNPFQNLRELRSLGQQQSLFGGTVAQSFGAGQGGRPSGGGGATGQSAAGEGATGGSGTSSAPTGTSSGSTTNGISSRGTGGFGGPGGGGGFGSGRSGGGGFGGRGGGFGGGGPGGGGRLQFALYHTWHFVDTVKIRDGVPVLDLLNGGAIGTGGQSRHELEGQAGYSNNGLGARLSATWQSATTVIGGTSAVPDTLHFSDLGKINLRLFADLGQQLNFVKTHHWAVGTRVTLSVNNLFDAKQRVTDGTGATPVSYQPDYLDPLGRTVMLSVRKLFL